MTPSISPSTKTDWGYTPHTIVSRLGEWRRASDRAPGLMLFASLVSEHVDEVLRLVNNNPQGGRGLAAQRWAAPGAASAVRSAPAPTSFPAAIEGCDVATLLGRLLRSSTASAARACETDIVRFRSFAEVWPGGDLGAWMTRP